MKKALGTERVLLEQSKGVREKGKKERNSVLPVGLEPTTSCTPGKHATTVSRGRLQVVGGGSGF